MAISANLTESIPLEPDKEGTFRVTGTRVTLDVIAESFRQGATPEQIGEQFPSLTLADVYAVLTWVLRNPRQLADYLARRESQAAAIRANVETLCPPEGFRQRLLARTTAGEP